VVRYGAERDHVTNPSLSCATLLCMSRCMRLGTNVDGRANALRRLMFVVQDDGSVAVLDEGAVVDNYPSLPRALISYGLRRTQLVPVES